MARTRPAPSPDASTGVPHPRRVGAVFYCSFALAVAFLVFGLLFPGRLETGLAAAQQAVVSTFGWGYLVVVFALLVLLLVLAVSPAGRVRLGGDDERPEFGPVSWVAMLMSAGVGLSFLFWGTAEPLMHYAEPPYAAVPAESEQAATMGMRYSFLFWGLHAWALYAVVAVAVGYSSFRHGRPVLVSAALQPLLGERVRGWPGTVIDVVAVLAILFGVATSLGLGTRELNAGLSSAFGAPDAYGVKIVIIAGLMTVSTLSALTGLGRGIRILSLVNVTLAAALLVFTLFAGPTRDLVVTAADSVAGYGTHLLSMSFNLEDTPGSDWEQEWTFFFWAWWISWSPFVGTFIARISRGRSIRGVVTGVVLVPSLVSAVWFSVFGGTALAREQSGTLDVADAAVDDSKAEVTFRVLQTLPWQSVTPLVVAAVLALLFITSADSASFMLGSTTSGGSLTPPKPLKLMWAFSAAFAAVLLLGGGTDSLQGAAVVAAVPFTLILLALAVSLVLALRRDRHRHPA